MARSWLVDDPVALATQRILDAAGRCFAEQGVARTAMADVAREAGCSRQTLYRYFDDRDALRTAFVHREARRLGQELVAGVQQARNPRDRLLTAVQLALRAVRDDPLLRAWFTGGNAEEAAAIAARSSVLLSLVLPVLGDGATDDAARWLVRVVLSLLTAPGGDEAEERVLLERFVLPVVLPADRRRAQPT